MNAQVILPRDFFQQVDIAQDEVRFGNDAQSQPLVPSQLLQDCSRHLVVLLRGLIRIGGSADGDFLAWFHLTELLAQESGGMLLDVNLLLEIGAVVHLHELMGVTGVAVFAGELATAIRINGPGKGHARAGRAVQ